MREQAPRKFVEHDGSMRGSAELRQSPPWLLESMILEAETTVLRQLVSKCCQMARRPPVTTGTASGRVVLPWGFEPLISALKGRSPLDRRRRSPGGTSSVSIRPCLLCAAVSVVAAVVRRPAIDMLAISMKPSFDLNQGHGENSMRHDGTMWMPSWHRSRAAPRRPAPGLGRPEPLQPATSPCRRWCSP